ncbi:SDR family NAD(P)-dependent oxidoreductase [Hirschia maritima]|uniref:SDR family NAD(P)-dependent oxidoreductase n=1 Tax=Hirschia maritima TaxID=1121961 RepID=UPI000362B2FB|nr:SDR family NAD(P)-dependent oxidoreductase [Hirschia maritima]
MSKTILLTGATDGIGLETARRLVSEGHTVLLHGRNPEKLQKVKLQLSELGSVESYIADMSQLDDVAKMADNILADHKMIDVVINNAGVLKTSAPLTPDGFDTRFVVNTFAPYLLTQKLLPIMSAQGRIINLSSAAQAEVNVAAMLGDQPLDDMAAYAQSKLAITMWTRAMAEKHKDENRVFIAVNPGSLLASKMVKEGFGMAGNDINIGVDILCRTSLSDEFANASGQYFDNDSGQIAAPQADGLDDIKIKKIVDAIESVTAKYTS